MCWLLHASVHWFITYLPWDWATAGWVAFGVGLRMGLCCPQHSCNASSAPTSMSSWCRPSLNLENCLIYLVFLSFIYQTVQFSPVKKLECCFDSCTRQTVRNETIVHATLCQEAYIWRRKLFRWCCNREHCMTFVYINKMTVDTMTSCTTNVGTEWHKKHQSQKNPHHATRPIFVFCMAYPNTFPGAQKAPNSSSWSKF